MNLTIENLADVYRVDYGVDEQHKIQHKVKVPLAVVLAVVSNGQASYRKCLLIK